MKPKRTQHSVYLTEKQIDIVKGLADRWEKSINGTINKMINDMILIMESENVKIKR